MSEAAKKSGLLFFPSAFRYCSQDEFGAGDPLKMATGS